jgi:hypothetical protein
MMFMAMTFFRGIGHCDMRKRRLSPVLRQGGCVGLAQAVSSAGINALPETPILFVKKK